MRRQSSFRIRKRDGREEWLRTSKLVRSISRALRSAEGAVVPPSSKHGKPVPAPAASGLGALEPDRIEFAVRREDWRAFDLASAVLTGLCRAGLAPSQGVAKADTDEDVSWTTDVLAAAVEQVLHATGFQGAATAYARARQDRERRRGELQAAMAPAESRRSVFDLGVESPRNPRTV